MTDRIHALTVILDKEYRDDDVEYIINAIRMIKGVSKVECHIHNIDVTYAEEKARKELRDKILDLLYPKTDK
jgi:hypothetical protein